MVMYCRDRDGFERNFIMAHIQFGKIYLFQQRRHIMIPLKVERFSNFVDIYRQSLDTICLDSGQVSPDGHQFLCVFLNF